MPFEEELYLARFIYRRYIGFGFQARSNLVHKDKQAMPKDMQCLVVGSFDVFEGKSHAVLRLTKMR